MILLKYIQEENMYSKEEKRAIGKEAYDKVDTLANLARTLCSL